MDWRRRLAGVSLIALSVAGVGTASWVYYDAWSTRQAYEASPQAAALAQQEVEPTPIWIAPATPEPAQIQRIVPVPAPRVPATKVPVPVATALVEPTPVPTASAEELSLDSTDFRFVDPPEPGAHARVVISVTNHADLSSGRVLLGIDSKWFNSYNVIGTAPAVSSQGTDDDDLRVFSFPPIAPGQTSDFQLHVAASEEGTRAPSVKVLLEDGEVIGAAGKLSTYAPPARPGPVMAIDIPRLQLHSGVVQIEWEPPPFNVGQIKGTANITQGNTVLIGHLTGAAGNIFAHLDQLELGDEITAVSRGRSYKFVVSQTFGGPNTDAAPMEPAQDARLTLMTCAGIWNPITHDYSERYWVIAEPPTQAEVTIANAQATATEVAAATATEVAAHPTETPTPRPTPYAGEPALPGGIGNTRGNLEKAFGKATGETSGKLVVFRPSGHEVRVRFSPDPPRARLVTVIPRSPLSFQDAVSETRKLFPTDTRPRARAPEGNSQIIVERFSSPLLELTIGEADFSVIYTKDAGAITSMVLGPGDDLDSLIAESRK